MLLVVVSASWLGTLDGWMSREAAETVQTRLLFSKEDQVHRFLLSLAFVVSVVGPFVGLPTPANAANCRFVLGFKAIHDAIPDMVGDCIDNEDYNPANGDALQHTVAWHGKGGLLAWRKADNWTAFTDGANTWVNGPNGIQKRLNSERFPWEGDSAGYPAPASSAAPALSGQLSLTVNNARTQLFQTGTPLGIQTSTGVFFDITLANGMATPLPMVGTRFYPAPLIYLSCPQGDYPADGFSVSNLGPGGAMPSGTTGHGAARVLVKGTLTPQACTFNIDFDLSSVQGYQGPPHVSALASIP